MGSYTVIRVNLVDKFNINPPPVNCPGTVLYSYSTVFMYTCVTYITEMDPCKGASTN